MELSKHDDIIHLDAKDTIIIGFGERAALHINSGCTVHASADTIIHAACHGASFWGRIKLAWEVFKTSKRMHREYPSRKEHGTTLYMPWHFSFRHTNTSP